MGHSIGSSSSSSEGGEYMGHNSARAVPLHCSKEAVVVRQDGPELCC